ncbi:hypothetical protein [Streptomyces sp. NPDC005438]|uniref:hypothetical protein n=1 Tax=Streptomyces sp. NPDC005438 TaxID=3156880 RepID=UPI0033B7900C
MEWNDSPCVTDVPPEQALLVIDMQGYSKIPESKMVAARSNVDDILDCALAHAGLKLPREDDGAYMDTGDGVILAFAPHVLARLIDPLLGELNVGLMRHERHRISGAPLVRLRASVHVGPLSLPDRRGDAINEACRLVSCQAVYRGLAAAAEGHGHLAAVISETVYRRAVAAGRTPHLGAQHFLPTEARVEGKPDFAEPCRIHVPGLTALGLRPYISDDDVRPRESSDRTEFLPDFPLSAQKSDVSGQGAGKDAVTFKFLSELHQPTIVGEIKRLRIDQRKG